MPMEPRLPKDMAMLDIATLDIATFEAGLDRYGADLAAWPADLRAAASACRDGAPEARAAHEALVAIEAWLRAARPVPTGIASMAARAMRHRQDRPMGRAARRAGWAVAAAVVLVLGLFVGSVGLDHDDGPDPVIASAIDPLGATDVD